MNENLDLIPLGTRIIVQTALGKEKVGSIIIPETAKAAELTEGTVIAIGEEAEEKLLDKNVYYGSYAGKTIERNGEKFVLMDESDILALVKEKEN